MKKILLSVIALFAAVSMNAQTAVNDDPSYFNLDKSSGWGGKWFDLGPDGNLDFDASAYEYVWIKFSGNTGKFRFGLTYSEWKSTEAWGETYFDAMNVIEDAEGISFIKLEKEKTYEFDVNKADNPYKGDTWDKHLRQVWTQDDGTEVSVTVEGIWFGTAAELKAALGGGSSEGGEEGGSDGGEEPTEDVGEPYKVNSPDMSLNNSSGWGGFWYAFGEDDAPSNFDASGYDYAWIKFSGNTGKFRFGVTYSEWKSTEAWGETYFDAMNVIEDAEGISFIKLEKEKTYEFGGPDKAESPYKGDTWDKHIQNVYTQDDGSEVSVTVEGIYFGTGAQLKAALGGETAIQKVQVVKAENGARYNLAGQKVDAAYKGIVIQNGKKFIQK